MKITNVTTYTPSEVSERGGSTFIQPLTLVKIDTDEGISGIGEGTLETKERTVATCVMEHERYLRGKDPLQIEKHWQAMYRGTYWRGGPVLNSAISAIEIALWDIAGKYYEAPIYALLGGNCRDKIKCYVGVGGNTHEELADNVELAMKDGYSAVKFMAYGVDDRMLKAVDEAERRCKAVRDRVGDEVDIMVECHGRPSLQIALNLVERLAKYKPLWIEEPLFPENIDALADLCRHSRVPLATGERLFTKWGFRELLAKRAAHIIQPDPIHCGGILETKKIAAMAESHFVQVAPHCPYFQVALAASVQIDAGTPNFLIQEGGRLRGKWLVKKALEVESGYIKLPTRPGLGVELDTDAIKENPYRSRVPEAYMTYREDGSIAEL
jgi:galactonate dehydratase